MQFLAGEGGAVNAVLADAAAGHDDAIAGQNALGRRRYAADQPGQGADRAAIDQRLAQVARIEIFPTQRVGNAALVAAVNDPLMHLVAQAARMEQAGRHVRRCGERRAKAVTPDIQQQLRAHAGA